MTTMIPGVTDAPATRDADVVVDLCAARAAGPHVAADTADFSWEVDADVVRALMRTATHARVA